MAGGGSCVSWFVGDGEGRSSPWLVVVVCESGCGGTLIVVCVWVVVVIHAPAWALVVGCGVALVVVRVWVAVVVQASTQALIECIQAITTSRQPLPMPWLSCEVVLSEMGHEIEDDEPTLSFTMVMINSCARY